MRRIVHNLVAKLARKSQQKYNTKTVIIFGWDWTEGFREAVYNYIPASYNVRRNTNWLRWDMALPLFILGQNYQLRQKKSKLILRIIKAYFVLLFPRKFQNLLVVSAYSENLATTKYWLSTVIDPVVVVLPFKHEDEEKSQEVIKYILSQKNVIDLRPTVKQTVGGSLKIILIGLLDEFVKKAEKLIDLDKKPSRDEITEAILKIDWERYYLNRIRTKLLQELDEDTA